MALSQVPISGLWLQRPRPQPEELFSSYLFRLAAANHLQLGRFVAMHVGRRVGSRDIDRTVDVEFVQKLAKLTNRSFQASAAGTLATWDLPLGNPTIAARSGGNARWFVKQRHGETTRRAPASAMQYCPACLDESIPYFRKRWRLSFVTHCHLHRTNLSDRCPNPSCASKSFYRAANLLAVGNHAHPVDLQRCAVCNANLCTSTLGVTPADLDVYNLQTALMTSLATDTVILPPIEAAPSKVLKVLRQVTKLLWIAETAPINRQQLFLASGISARVPDTGPRNLYFDAATLEFRLPVVQATAWLLKDWPHRYTSYREACGVRRGHTLKSLRAFALS